eukprot:scaffold72594_cov30-Tisochrysis_lutea.AAC.1
MPMCGASGLRPRPAERVVRARLATGRRLRARPSRAARRRRLTGLLALRQRLRVRVARQTTL